MPRTIIENIVIQEYKEQTFFEFCKYTTIRFFEIVYFEKGTGTIKINGKTVNYSANSIFVFVPDDIYIVNPESATTTVAIKFLKSFFRGDAPQNANLPINDWFRKIEGILNSESHQLREMRFETESDKIHLISLIKMVAAENDKKKSYDLFIIQNSLSVILHLIARNIQFLNADMSTKIVESSKIQQIINFIHANIYNSELLTTKNLAEEFHMADNYISEYFKKHTDVSLKKYILNYKLKLVETRLKYTDLQFSEIAMELGFTDSSHLNKTFQSYKGMTIGAYKASISA
ncbi:MULTISPECIES: AraC family transcriptional regulator [Flavobacteriaceae]|uniref:Transcriptional regulator, AraC family n=1 Tax=Cellulophaga lytica (strain ATCC 23178 / DSM 7489 / JCM 8516 / NBRC 14961 / NCIMB 1423 / VKM B-1433 / Cy l20) TaxID=867900 RepID=F0RBN7_CELLC|nr:MULTISPECIES: AraC family transcriptional regulator [Flavobacteriaceae]ADY30687.1 transcriptional regulator, AraC family [Cellulophaga lytica DSM 7489]AIM61669.1 AraC family transcriptional regulator [Cellulophaga lytica]TVZ10001.1 AraC-like DNA-binding protein [Cellulophaga sp. RHA_52]WQG78387.1 AraC family transcriptional regulator [Cellulophaga lytica]SNQ44708.1 Transcriptional regulator, AraC family [Cellulophaga lytica]